jgi:hypothetical protein
MIDSGQVSDCRYPHGGGTTSSRPRSQRSTQQAVQPGEATPKRTRLRPGNRPRGSKDERQQPSAGVRWVDPIRMHRAQPRLCRSLPPQRAARDRAEGQGHACPRSRGSDHQVKSGRAETRTKPRPVGRQRQHRSQPAVASSAFEASTRVWDLSSNHLVAGASRPDDHLVNLVVVHQDPQGGPWDPCAPRPEDLGVTAPAAVAPEDCETITPGTPNQQHRRTSSNFERA